MKKKLRALLSLTLALIMCLSLSVGAFAETVAGTVEVETSIGKNETVDVTITIENSNNEHGGVTTETTTEASGFVTEDGMTVNYSGSSTEIRDEEGNLLPGSNSQSAWDSVNAPGTYGADGGSDSKVVENSGTGTVDVPVTAGGSDTAYGAAAGTTVTTGDTDKSDGFYDYTTETVLQQGSVKVETTDITVGVDKVETEYESDMELVKSETNATADNDLTDLVGRVYESDAAEIEKASDGFQYVLVGTQNASQFWAQLVYNEPQFEGEEPVYTYTDPTTGEERSFYKGGGYYHSCYNAEGMYLGGEMVTEDTIKARWSSLESFMLVDPATGKITTTYCADSTTPTVNGYSYNMENVEDASYYTDAQAAMIRTVALNGYWGAADDPNTSKLETGSLEAVRQMMREAKDANGKAVFTEEEINALNEGTAMTATQLAIWTFSNYMDGVTFINCQYIPKDENNQTDLTLINDKSRPKPGTNKVYTWVDFLKNVPESEMESVDLIFKLYDHLINMEPTEITEANTGNTVITKDNFIKDMSLTVIDKVDDHTNNADNDDTNDVYVTELSFALVVTPSTENGDDMIVQVVGPEGIVAEARIAGEAKEGETLQYLTPDANGNFIFSGITMTEGNQNFNITLQGIQNLEQGVYLYTSEIRDDVPSQTMVGIAEGAHAVNVSMDISFELNVEDEVVAKEHVWRTEWDPSEPPPYNPPPPPENPPEEPPEEILEEPVPLAKAPVTGGISAIFAISAAVSGLGLAGICISGKRRDEE